MFDSTRVFLFLTAAVLLAVAPGPGMLYVLARSLAGGKREGVLSALGTFLGGMVHVLAAALGVSVILARSAMAFATVKYAGAAYLCFLGVKMILDSRKKAEKQEAFSPDDLIVATSVARNPLWQGVATEVLNPKTALFFLSFIPQFVNRGAGHVFFQFVLLGTASVVLRHLSGFDRDPALGADRQEDSVFGNIPTQAENGHRCDHDRAGDVLGDERKPLTGSLFLLLSYNSKIWWSWQSVRMVS